MEKYLDDFDILEKKYKSRTYHIRFTTDELVKLNYISKKLNLKISCIFRQLIDYLYNKLKESNNGNITKDSATDN